MVVHSNDRPCDCSRPEYCISELVLGCMPSLEHRSLAVYYSFGVASADCTIVLEPAG